MTQEEFFTRYKYDVNSDKIGIGTFGTVYKAYDNSTNRFVALKISEVKTIGNKRFSLKDEFGIFKELPSHPNIVRYEHVFTFQQPTGTYDFAVMPYYPAGSLRDILQSTPHNREERESIALKILDGLEFLHNHNIIHRDLKPSNILMEVQSTTEGATYNPVITDFGLSKISEPDNKSRFTSSFEGGTLQYSSPEQLKGEAVRYNADLWSWAVISYKLLTGKELFPFENKTGEIQVLMKILEDDVTTKLAELPDNWRIALYDALIKDPAQRIKSATELKNILPANNENLLEPAASQPAMDEFEEVEPDDYEEVLIENTNTSPTTKPAPTFTISSPKPTTTTVIVNEKPGKKRWPLVLLLLITVPALYYFLTNSELFCNKLSEKKAKAILINMMNYRSEGRFEQIQDVFADKTDKYFSENDVSRSNIIRDMEKFAESWAFEDVKIVDFGRTVEDMFHFAMTYNLRDKKTLQITSYSVHGEVGYIQENGQYKINYITNRGVSNNRNEFKYSTVSVRKQQDFNDYMLTYNALLMYLPEIKDDYLLNYIYADLFQQQPSGFTKEQLQKAVQDDYIDFINFSENQMRTFVVDSVSNFSKQIEMTTAFVDANFLSLQIVQNVITGIPLSKFSLNYRNVDYAEGRVLNLNDVINVNAVPWTELMVNGIDSRMVTAGGKTISRNDLSTTPQAPENFYFDTKKMFFVYGANELTEAAEFGPITLAVPLSELDRYLTPYFKSKIFNSSKVNVKKV